MPAEVRDAYRVAGTIFRLVLEGDERRDVDLSALLADVEEAQLDGTSFTGGHLHVPARQLDVSVDALLSAPVPTRKSRFTVDTQVFRELGSLLVGRDSTAVLELIKNAYDADATVVTVSARGLGASGHGVLQVVDDGNGMTVRDFERGFLRIASRAKAEGSRRSARFGRRLTGAKGVGRLAVHKLAERLVVDSMPSPPMSLVEDQAASQPRTAGVHAELDWSLIEHQPLLENVSAGLVVEEREPAGRSGTALRLERLRGRWTPQALMRFADELRTAQPATAFHEPLPPWLLREPLMLERHRIRDVKIGRSRDKFSIRYEDELEVADELFPLLLSRTSWLLEIDALGPEVRYAISPTTMHQKDHPLAAPRRFSLQHPAPDSGPFFSARVLIREGPAQNADLRRAVEEQSGIRIYWEGFRVLPYGSRGDDWLFINRDYARKPRLLDVDDELDAALPGYAREGFYTVGTAQYAGAVFLLESGAQHLEALVNREGFVVNDAFEVLQRLVTNGVRLSVRVRRALAVAEQAAKGAPGPTSKAPSAGDAPTTTGPISGADGAGRPPSSSAAPVRANASTSTGYAVTRSVATLLDEARSRIASLQSAGPSAEEEVRRVADVLDQARASALPDEEAVAMRILAGVGLQMGAFVHEVNGILGQAEALQRELDRLDTGGLTPGQRRTLRRIERAAMSLVETLQRQSSYLTDIIGPRARSRRSRTRVLERLDRVLLHLRPSAEARRIIFHVEVDAGVRTPPMFPSEVSILLTNLLTNAVKNARSFVGGDVDQAWVRVVAQERPGLFRLEISNTGVRVDLSEAHRWFEPFETTSPEVDDVLGQGLGLGLPIVRRLVSDYRGTIDFVEPVDGAVTTIRIDLPLTEQRSVETSAQR